LADVVGGSSRNFQFQIRNAADVNFMDTQYGTYVATADTYPVGSVSSNSISSGSLTIQKATDSPSGNITDGTSDVTLAKYTITAYGEPMKIETLYAGATSSDISVGSLRNGRILINGVQYGSTATLSSTTNSSYSAGGTSYTLNYTVQPGTPITLEIHADMFDNSGANNLGNNDTVTAVILGNDGSTINENNVQRMVSLGYVDGPSTYVLGNALTDVSGSVTLSKNNTYANQNAPLPQTNYKLGSFNLVGSNSEDVNLSSIDLAVVASTSLTSVNDVKLMIAGNMFGTVKSSVTVSSGGSSTSTYSGNYTLVKNSTVAVEVWATINAPSSSYSSDTFKARLALSGTTANSSASVSANAEGQTITVGSATITAAQDPSTPVAAITAGNSTKTAAAFKWTTTNDSFTISEVVVSIASNTTVSNVILKDGSTTLGTQPGMASTTFSNLNIPVSANSTKILTVELQLASVGTGAGTSGENVKVNLYSYKSAPASTGAISTTTHGTSVTGNNLFVYKTIPTITNVALPSSTLSAGSNTIYKFSLSSGGAGTIGWAKFLFSITTSTGVTVTSPQLWDADTNTQVTGNSSTSQTSNGIAFEFQPTAEQQVSGTKTYVVKATVAITGTGAKTVSTNLAQPSGFASPAAATSATATTATFVWSDLSAQSHSLTSSDWNNDYLVKNMPTDSQGLSASY
jgi:hypothetical protein